MKFENNVKAFLTALNRFNYDLDCADYIWEIIFPDEKRKWHYARIVKYRETYYIQLIDAELCMLEMDPEKGVQTSSPFGGRSPGTPDQREITVWDNLITSLRHWLKVVQNDWIEANRQAQKSYPLKRRFGVVSNSLVRTLLSDIYRIDQELGKENTEQFIQLVENGYFRDEKNTTRKSMSAKDFFDYCKIAYIAGQRESDAVDQKLSGRDMYKCYADGRDEGLLEIDLNSKEEFAAWIDGKHPKKTVGGHPWEIKRGGNTTHIDLYVSRSASYTKEGFKVTLRGESIGRLHETILMFLAIYKAGLPIGVTNPEGIRKRLLAQDNIGIVPCYASLHRANQHFSEEQAVFDVLYFDDLGKHKAKIKPFITWEALPILTPKR